MKNLKVDWLPENPWDVEVQVGRADSEANGSTKAQSKATKRIVITESGVVLRQCVRAI
jgi:hypothetical protein